MQTRTPYAPLLRTGADTVEQTLASAVQPRIQFQPDPFTIDGQKKSTEYGAPSETSQFKSVNELSRLTDTVDKTWNKMVTMYEGMYDDIENLAKFNEQVQDALLREGIFAGCIKAGIGFLDLLYLLLIVTL